MTTTNWTSIQDKEPPIGVPLAVKIEEFDECQITEHISTATAFKQVIMGSWGCGEPETIIGFKDIKGIFSRAQVTHWAPIIQ